MILQFIFDKKKQLEETTALTGLESERAGPKNDQLQNIQVDSLTISAKTRFGNPLKSIILEKRVRRRTFPNDLWRRIEVPLPAIGAVRLRRASRWATLSCLRRAQCRSAWAHILGLSTLQIQRLWLVNPTRCLRGTLRRLRSACKLAKRCLVLRDL